MEQKPKELEAKKLHPEEVLLSWDAPEFLEHERDAKWYIGAAVLALGLLGYSLYTKDWFFAVVVVIIAIVSLRYLKIKPNIKKYGITRVGIYIDERFYPFDQLHSFWVVYQPPLKILNILSTRRYLPQLTIQLEDQDPVMIKNILKKFIPEQEKRGEAVMDKVSRILKF